MANTAYIDFLKDPDQPARRAELANFIGPNANAFIPVYDRLQEDAASGKPKFRLFGGGFSVVAFLCLPVWFFYRKMWLIAGFITVAMIAIGFIPGASRAGLPIGVLLGLIAHRTYVQHAIVAIQKLRRPDGTVDPAELRRVGGVSRTAGWISGLAYGALCLLSLWAIIWLVQAGEPIPR
ncbi:DUF2628 domain-containing protein [Sphingomonas sp. ASY06-1R]|uniref:DUF2628 domain-containing protein n=1 Tax=Sphingomonas sp. ASY06-1R TaxID=3445771 RepID=UPI003FA29B87